MKIKIKDPTEFKKLLAKNGYTQTSFGKAIGVSQTFANQIVNGTRNLKADKAKKTINLFNVEFEDIFTTVD
ncbi:MAG: helix-turn-helix transcriptional regulator [Tepidibacillus sp.]